MQLLRVDSAALRAMAPASSLIEVLNEDEDIEDVVPLSGQEVPDWLRRLSVPIGWHLIEIRNDSDPPLTRMVVHGPRGRGEWAAAETISVFGYTGWLTFYDVLHNADGTLHGLKATNITVQVLPVPPIQWTAAVRSSGIAVIGERSVWIQESNYVAGSEQPHEGRLIVHRLLVDTTRRAQLARDLTQLSDAAYTGFVAALPNQRSAG